MSDSSRIELHIATSTIIKLLISALLTWMLIRLWPELVFMLISLVLAVACEPLVTWLNARGISRGVCVGMLAAILFGGLGVLLGFVLPPLINQIGELIRNLPTMRDEVLRGLGPQDGVTRHLVERLFALPTSPQVEAQLSKVLVWGEATVSSIVSLLFMLIIALYLVLDGRRLYAWLLAYVPRAHRQKVRATIPEVTQVVYAYVRGQAVVSALFILFSSAVLTCVGVPAVGPLAVLAGACDVLPAIGVILATAPAAVLALTVSPIAALVVVALYVGYHLFETYFLVPRLYGNTLRLSTLTVLLALVLGASLAGAAGALLVLPAVAAYPIIERIWLRDYLAPEVIADHKALDRAPDNDKTIGAVIQGEKHAGEREPTAVNRLPSKPPQP